MTFIVSEQRWQQKSLYDRNTKKKKSINFLRHTRQLFMSNFLCKFFRQTDSFADCENDKKYRRKWAAVFPSAWARAAEARAVRAVTPS